jgi:hypothetical protein
MVYILVVVEMCIHYSSNGETYRLLVGDVQGVYGRRTV